MSSNIQTEQQLVRAMTHYIVNHHTAIWRLHKQTDDSHGERSKRINELTFEIFSELAFKAYDKEFKTIVGDEEEE